jgi:uncharacterized damage-inducible protein DinB
MANRVFEELLHGKGAHADPLTCIEDVSTELAGKTIEGFPHSIWQLVSHMNFWMDYEIKRVAGVAPSYPDHASLSWPTEATPASETHWSDAKTKFNALLQKLSALAQSPPDVLAREVKPTHSAHRKMASSLQSVLWQTLVHNSYHIGQIALIRCCFRAWPPRSGGDTW